MKKLVLLTIAILYLSFIVLDIKGSFIEANYIKFASISLIFILSLFKNNGYAVIGLLLTVVCDYLLLFTQKYSLGIMIFSISHLLYINSQLKKDSLTTVLSLGLPFLFIFFGIIIQCLFYLLLMLFNILISIKKENAFVFAAFILFALCDVCVAGFNITNSYFLMALIWIFYVPSQALLALKL